MMTVRDDLKSRFERLGWEFSEVIDKDHLLMTVILKKGKAKFKRIIEEKTMDLILNNENYIRFWVEETDNMFNNLLTLGGN